MQAQRWVLGLVIGLFIANAAIMAAMILFGDSLRSGAGPFHFIAFTAATTVTAIVIFSTFRLARNRIIGTSGLTVIFCTTLTMCLITVGFLGGAEHGKMFAHLAFVVFLSGFFLAGAFWLRRQAGWQLAGAFGLGVVIFAISLWVVATVTSNINQIHWSWSWMFSHSGLWILLTGSIAVACLGRFDDPGWLVRRTGVAVAIGAMVFALYATYVATMGTDSPSPSDYRWPPMAMTVMPVLLAVSGAIAYWNLVSQIALPANRRIVRRIAVWLASIGAYAMVFASVPEFAPIAHRVAGVAGILAGCCGLGMLVLDRLGEPIKQAGEE